MEEVCGDQHTHTGRATASACCGSLQIEEPSEFVDSAITGYNLTVTHCSPQSLSQQHQKPPPPPAAVNDHPANGGTPVHCYCWGHCLCRDSHRGQQRRQKRHGGHLFPSSQVGGASAADAAARKSLMYDHVQNFGHSFYAYLHSDGSNLQSGAGSSHAHSNASHKPKTLNVESPDLYESKLQKARWGARSVGAFYNLSTFLALCSLTWATVVLLGAFVDDLRFVDYVMVTALLLLEAVRLASAAFFTILLTHGLARSSQDPQNIIHGKDDQYRRALAARILSSLLQAVLISPSFVCPIIRLGNIEYDNPNIHNSLLIFYLLVICNASVSSGTLFCSSASFIYLRDRYDQSILRFYDELVQRAISFGVIQADDFGFIQFAYRMLGREFVRIVQPEAVVKNHRKLIEYLYRHRLGQDFLLVFLEDDDAFVQQAAVNMVGFWADPSKKVGLKELKLSKKVLTEMADKVGSGQLGWAAVNSFGGVARRNPSILAETRLSCGVPLLDRLADLVDGESSGSLAYVRTLALFYHYSHQRPEQEVPLLGEERKLAGKLKQLLAGARVQRPRLFAAYLLHLMRHLDESCYDDVAAIRPSKDAYWFQVEVDLLLFIRKQCKIFEPPPDLADVPRGFIRKDDNIGPDGKRFL